jgi:hypothetical protein
MTRIPTIATKLPCSAAALCLALVTTILPGSASAQIEPAGNLAYLGLFHTSENANVCINDPGQSTTNGTQIRVSQNCNTNDPASLWVLMPITFDAGVYVMWNPHANKCLVNDTLNQSNGNPIILWDCNGDSTQQWVLRGLTTLHYQANQNKCVTIAWDKGTLILYDCDGNRNQNFGFTTVKTLNVFYSDNQPGSAPGGCGGTTLLFPNPAVWACWP